MTNYAWRIDNLDPPSGVGNVTNVVLAATWRKGRSAPFEPYPGGQLVLRVNNSNNESSYFALGNRIKLSITGKSGFDIFVVHDITFDDTGGNFAGSTATITCYDGLAVAGRVQVRSVSLGADPTSKHIYDDLRSYLPASVTYTNTTGVSSASAATYSGTVLNRVNLNCTTEGTRAVLQGTGTAPNEAALVTILSRSAGITDSGATLARQPNSSTNTIGYTALERFSYRYNDVTVSPDGLASQNEQASVQFSTVGQRSVSYSTVDATTTQADDLAKFILAAFSTPDTQLRASFSSATDPARAFPLFAWLDPTGVITVTADFPGGGSGTFHCYAEGFEANITPQETLVSVILSNADTFSSFVLNSSIVGVLNTNKLGW